MATSQEILELVYRVQGESELKALNALAAKHAETLRFLVEQNQHLTTAELANSAAVRHQADAMATAQKQAAALEQRLNATTSKLAGTGQALLQSGRVVQDFFQGGFLGVLNNIEGLVQSLGGPAGLAGILTVAGTAAMVAAPHIKKLIESFGGADTLLPALDRLKARVEELQKMGPTRLAVEDKELTEAEEKIRRLTRAKQVLDELMGAQDVTEATSGKAFREALVETPGGQEAMARAMTRQADARVAASVELKENREAQARLEVLVKSGRASVAQLHGLQEEAKKIAGRIRTDSEKEFGLIEAEAQTGRGPAQARAQEAMAGMLRAAGAPADLMQKLTMAHPEVIVTPEARKDVEELVANVVEREKKEGKEQATAEEARNKEMWDNAGAIVDAHFDAEEGRGKAVKAVETATDKLRALNKQLDQERKAAVKEAVAPYAKTFDEPLLRAMRGGATNRALEAQVARLLQAGGQVDKEFLAEGAAMIVGDVRQTFLGEWQGGVNRQGIPQARRRGAIPVRPPAAGTAAERPQTVDEAREARQKQRTAERGAAARAAEERKAAREAKEQGEPTAALANPLQNGQEILAGGQAHLASVLGQVMDRQAGIERLVRDAMTGLDATGRTAMSRTA